MSKRENWTQRFFGLVPEDTRDALTNYPIVNLQRLLAVLVTDRSRRTVATSCLILDPSKFKWEVLENFVAIAKMSREKSTLNLTASPQRQASTKRWPDRIFLTTGMPGKY
jgi:hypothetical protein